MSVSVCVCVCVFVCDVCILPLLLPLLYLDYYHYYELDSFDFRCVDISVASCFMFSSFLFSFSFTRPHATRNSVVTNRHIHFIEQSSLKDIESTVCHDYYIQSQELA